MYSHFLILGGVNYWIFNFSTNLSAPLQFTKILKISYPSQLLTFPKKFFPIIDIPPKINSKQEKKIFII